MPDRDASQCYIKVSVLRPAVGCIGTRRESTDHRECSDVRQAGSEYSPFSHVTEYLQKQLKEGFILSHSIRNGLCLGQEAERWTLVLSSQSLFSAFWTPAHGIMMLP